MPGHNRRFPLIPHPKNPRYFSRNRAAPSARPVASSLARYFRSRLSAPPACRAPIRGYHTPSTYLRGSALPIIVRPGFLTS